MTTVDSIHRLAVYGTLAPGRPNAHVLAGIPGRWIAGTVGGELRHSGWGAELGYPGIVLTADGSSVDVMVLESDELLDHWERLDAFEGPGYRREITTVLTSAGELGAAIYVLAPPDR